MRQVLVRKRFPKVARGLRGGSPQAALEARAMTRSNLRRERMRNAYLHLFGLLILLPAVMPLPLLALLK